MPCQQYTLCPDQEILQEPNFCKDEALQPLPIPIINGRRITLACNECFLHYREPDIKVLCIPYDGYCDPCCCKETTPAEPEVV